MQLLGIYIRKEQKGITKILQEDWYPFGNYKKPAQRKVVKVTDTEQRNVAKKIYQREGLPEISVNTIVGMNGAGKSTLLDIYYRIINNFAFRMLGTKGVKSTGRELQYARGVHADLFFICEGNQYKIACRDLQTTLYKNEEGDSFTLVTIKDSDDPKAILRNFFYTISTNYSIYAFNEKEYVPDGIVANIDSGINGDWLNGLFHKNDGYFTPIVITPYREQGNIDVERENRLAAQRVMVLAILAKAQNNTFFIQYDPYSIEYSLNMDYKEKTEKQLRNIVFEKYPNLDISHVIRRFEFAWEKYLDTIYPDVLIAAPSKDMRYQALFYLAYKTAKICMNYEDYKKVLKLDHIVNAANDGLSTLSEYLNYKFPALSEAVIRKILSEIQDNRGDRSHITLKLSVCLDYMKSIYQHRPLWGMQNSIPVDDLIAGKQIRTYNDAVLALPPAFYNLKLKFRPKDQEAQQPIDSSWNMGTLVEDGEFTIDKMSSGERQMLYSLSYILYHIKNIQSVREDENRVAYHNICLIFDEAELYFHPDYQRRFLSMLLEAISWCNIDTERIHSIQILIVTHSPFILTDMLTENTLYLEKGKVKKVTQQTFGGNYYDLLNKSFFFEKSAVGDVAIRNLNKWIELSNQGETISEDILALVGDDLIRGYLSRN